MIGSPNISSNYEPGGSGPRVLRLILAVTLGQDTSICSAVQCSAVKSQARITGRLDRISQIFSELRR